MTNYKFLLAILLIPILLLTSCRDDEKSGETGNAKTVTCNFSLSVTGMESTSAIKSTRNIDPTTVSDNFVNDLWVLQFQSGTLKTCTYLSSVDTTSLKVKLLSGVSDVYFIANAGSSAFSSYVVGTTTETTFESASKSLSAETDVLENSTYVPMYGTIQSVTVPYVASQKVTLTRILARITVNYSSSVSNFQISRIRICNVPNTMQYYPPTSSTTLFPSSPSPSTENSFNYTIIPSTGYTNGSYSFYVPENQRGTGTNTGTADDPTLKSGVSYATYIKVVGYTTGTTNAGQEIVYTIYPGADNYNDYNICRNTYYQLTANITGLSPADSRVTLIRANCYIVAPGQIVKIPLARANDSDLGTQISNLKAPGYSFGTVWTSASGVISSCTQSTADQAEGVFEVTAGSTAGNAVVYIKNSSDSILWSWHIWVTSYNPNVTNISYNGQTWMDRNLGATDNSTTASYGLYYQWGRKDPFQGQNYTVVIGNTTCNLTNSIRNPSTFYDAGYNTSTYTDWYTNIGGSKNYDLWSCEKTVYDPCPAGWKVPASGSWSTLTKSNFTNSANSLGLTYTGSPSFFYPLSGVLGYDGSFDYSGIYGECWSSSDKLSENPKGFDFDKNNNEPIDYEEAANAFGVRCVQDN